MKTEETLEAVLTEAVMAKVQKKVDLPTHIYNPVFSAVLETLNEHLPAIRLGMVGLTRKEFLQTQ